VSADVTVEAQNLFLVLHVEVSYFLQFEGDRSHDLSHAGVDFVVLSVDIEKLEQTRHKFPLNQLNVHCL